MVDGRHAGTVGEEITIEPGIRAVTIKVGDFTCPSLQVELKPGLTTILQYRTTWLAWASLFMGLFLFMVLIVPVLIALEDLINWVVDKLPPIIGLGVLIAILAVSGWLTFGAPLRMLAFLGLHSHALTESRVN
jgi:hypothetical protein